MLRSTLICLVAAALSVAQEKPPEGSAPKPYKLPPVETFRLKNGMQVTLVPYGSVPKVAIEARIRAGNYLEGPKQVWLADLTGEALKEGTSSKTATQVAEAAALMGGQIDIGVSEEFTSATADVLSEFGPDAVALLADVLQNPRLPASELPRLKEGLSRRLAIAKSQPGALAEERFRSALYPDQPYGRIFPTQEMIAAYTPEDVRGFYAKNMGAQRTHLYVAGRFDAAAMRKAITAAFSNWAKGTEPEILTAKTTARPVRDLLDRPGAPQSTIRLGLGVAGPNESDKIAQDVADAILGGSFASRITTNIREQKGYTYSPRSTVSSRYHEAHWVEAADVTTAVTGPALHEIFAEIERLRKEPPGAEELKGIQHYLAGVFVLRNSSREGIIGQLAFVDFQGLPKDYLSTYVQNVIAVKPGDVQRIAEKYFTPSKMSLVVVGDKAKIADQVKPYLAKPE